MHRVCFSKLYTKLRKMSNLLHKLWKMSNLLRLYGIVPDTPRPFFCAFCLSHNPNLTLVVISYLARRSAFVFPDFRDEFPRWRHNPTVLMLDGGFGAVGMERHIVFGENKLDLFEMPLLYGRVPFLVDTLNDGTNIFL